MIKCLFIGIGGFIGSVLRYLIGLIPVQAKSGFPIKTLIINIVGSFMIGLIVAYVSKNQNVNENIILMLKIGICGGFTTFSTFAYETSDLIQKGNVGLAILYMLLSCVLGVLAVFGAEYIIK